MSALSTVCLQQLIKRKRRKFCGKFCFRDADVAFEEVTSTDVVIEGNNLGARRTKCAGTQFSSPFSEHNVNAEKTEAVCMGMNHIEGGWPRDINPTDMEQTIRFRKKAEKDENYPHIILNLGVVIEHGIQQNNSLNVYRKYFDDIKESNPDDVVCSSRTTTKVLTVLRDPLGRGIPVSGMSWSANKKLVTAFSNAGQQCFSVDLQRGTFVWDMDECPKPELALASPSTAVCVEFNPKDPCCVVGGCCDGQLMYWDIRKGSLALDASLLEEGHQECIQSVLFLNSKTGTEFFSASADGMICWWDLRKLCRPIDSLVLDPSRGDQMSRIMGATCLEFEPTMSTKFMVGTETGTVFLCNSKAKSIQEKLAAMYSCHLGPVQNLQRNPMFPKNFLTVGDWTAKIWSEDVRESPIMWTRNHMTHITAGCWSGTRPSVFLTTTSSGFLQVWDVLLSLGKPATEIKVSDSPLTCIRLHDGGRLVACGAEDGRFSLMQIGEEHVLLRRNDKQLLTALFEREARREKILEARHREQKLRERTPDWDRKNSTGLSAILSAQIAAAENQFFESLKEESASFEHDNQPPLKTLNSCDL